MPGHLVRSQRTVKVTGGDVIEVDEYSPHEVGALSFGGVARAVMPGYAQLPLSVQDQQAAILAYLRDLPRKAKAPKPADNGPGVVGTAVGIATDFAPIIGELKDLYRAVTGVDPDTGKKIPWYERILAGIGAIPIIGKLAKGLGKGIKWFGRGLSWVGGKGAAAAAWLTDKFLEWRRARRAKQIAGAVTPTFEQVKKLTPRGRTWQEWGLQLFGQGPSGATALLGKRSRRELEALGLNAKKAEKIRDWYKAEVDAGRGGPAGPVRVSLLNEYITTLSGPR